MERLYSGWTIADDRTLCDNRRLTTAKLASMLGRGLRGVEARLEKLRDVESSAYARLFGGDGGEEDDKETSGGEHDGGEGSKEKLTPSGEVLRRIRWDVSLTPADFSVLHYDRVEDCLVETSFDAPNDQIAGGEEQFVLALPEHRIIKIKFRERVVWDRERRLDLVFGSGTCGDGDASRGTTIDVVVETYEEWKHERDDAVERNRLRSLEAEAKLRQILDDERFEILGNAIAAEAAVGERVKFATTLFREAQSLVTATMSDSGNGSGDANDEGGAGGAAEGDKAAVVDFLHLLSELVASSSPPPQPLSSSLPDGSDDPLMRDELLNEISTVVERLRGNEGKDSGKKAKKNKRGGASSLPELEEDDLDEKFVRGSGAGGQKVNKTSNKVLLVHVPTQLRVECQDTRSLQQNRKIARKRLRLKLDDFLNGDRSRNNTKASAAATKKVKSKARNARRNTQKEKMEKKKEKKNAAANDDADWFD